MSMKAEKQASKWYVIRVQANREKSISEKLIKEGEKGDLVGKIGRVIVPMEKIFFIKNGKKVMREKVIYPNYIFVETNDIDELKNFIKGINGVSGFLTNRSGDAQPLTQSEVDKMLSQHQMAQEKEISNTFVVGEKVNILDGPFAKFNGVIEEINNQRVKVSVSIFGRKTPVELSILQIEKKLD